MANRKFTEQEMLTLRNSKYVLDQGMKTTMHCGYCLPYHIGCK